MPLSQETMIDECLDLVHDERGVFNEWEAEFLESVVSRGDGGLTERQGAKLHELYDKACGSPW